MGFFGEAIGVQTYFKDSNLLKNASHDFSNGPFTTVVVSSKLLSKFCGKLSQDHRS